MKVVGIILALCWLAVACAADDISRIAADGTYGNFSSTTEQKQRVLPEELQGMLSVNDVRAEWPDANYIYFVNPPPDSNAEQLKIEVRGHNVERYRYGLVHRDTWCTEDDLTNEAKLDEAIVFNASQLGEDGVKVLCALPVSTATSKGLAFSTLRWEKNSHAALLLNNLPTLRSHQLRVTVQNSAKENGFSRYYYKVLNGLIDCAEDQSAYRERSIDATLVQHLQQPGWYTLCVTGDYEHIRTHQWLYRPLPVTDPPQLLLDRKEIAFTLGDNRSVELGVWNNGGNTLVWEGKLLSNEDRTDISWKPYQEQAQVTELLPRYELPWLEMRDDGRWFTAINKDNPQSLSHGKLARGDTQQLAFRIADADNNYASWWQGLSRQFYTPYQYTKVLHFTNLATNFSAELALTLYIPELRLSHQRVRLSPDNTRQMVDVKNSGRGDFRWQVRATQPAQDDAIYAIGVALNGEDAHGRLHGEGIVMFAIDEPLPRTRTRTVFEFSYMGGETVSLPVEFVP